MNRFELQRLRDLPIEGVAERLGLRVERHKSLCPFHEDSHPSLSYRVSNNTCRCFVCMTKSMGPIDLVMRHLNKDFKEACRWLADEHNIILDEWKPAPIEVVQRRFDATRYERFFERPWLNEEARRFLFEERRIDPRVVRWCRLTSWRDRQGVPWLQIPYYNREGKLVGVQNRNLSTSTTSANPSTSTASANPSTSTASANPSTSTASANPSGAPRFRFPAGSECGIYNLPVLNLLRPGEQLFIAEGCSDCWSLLSAGHKAIAIPSATLLTQKDIELLKGLNSCLSFHMYPDNDVPGERLFLQLQQVLPSLVRHQLPPGCKDFSDNYVQLRSSS